MSRSLGLPAWIRSRGGIAHSRDALAAGFSAFDMATAVGSGLVHRVRRSWLVLPDADVALRAAATVGGRATCVTAAQREGWWTPAHTDLHIAVAHSASRLNSSGIRLHRSTAPVPVGPTTIREPAVNILFQVARCLPRVDALAVWEAALRRGVVDPLELSSIRWRSTRASELASVADRLSDSGLETVFVDDMRGAGIAVRQQVWIDGHPVDALIGERLVVQLDGFAHHQDARDRRRDLAADARLRLRGYTVLRFDFQQVLFDREYVLRTVGMALAQGLHLAA